MITAQDISAEFLESFPHEPTDGQTQLLKDIAEFLVYKDAQFPVFLVKGFAGTGKTTIIGTLVNALPKFKLKTALLAPTGRSAKVMAAYSNKPAFTIHKKIYRLNTRADGTLRLTLQQNLHKDTIFIVDEASMINDGSLSDGASVFGNQDLLSDLFEYVYSGNNCFLILVGDTAQLPPVRMDVSPALDARNLERSYTDRLFQIELKDVMRQAEHSGILYNATKLRCLLEEKVTESSIKLKIGEFEDVIKVNGENLEDALNTELYRYAIEDAVVICRSNKRANVFNQEIRKRILYHEEEITTGDLMMVVRNNYFWLDEKSTAGFIANGDIIEIQSIQRYHELYGFRFAEVTVRMVDYSDEKEIDVILLLDTIMSEAPALTFDQNRSLFDAVMEDYADIPSKRRRVENTKNNKFFNALQVKFAYALTCHKAQGGQWKTIFIDQGYLAKNMINREYVRWLYTAITRATERTYLINFDESFFEEEI